MIGLLRSNIYAFYANVRLMMGILIVLGLFVIAMDNTIPSLLIGYELISIVGCSAGTLIGMRREGDSKWEMYQLTLPVRRKQVVASYYCSQLYGALIGIGFANAVFGLSVVFHGFPFDRGVDPVVLMAAGLSVSLWMSGVFFPLSYLAGRERKEVVLMGSIGIGIGAVLVTSTMLNRWLGTNQTNAEILLGCGVMLGISIIAMAISYPLTVYLFMKKEY